jgi:CheY-like chemotaxis protein
MDSNPKKYILVVDDAVDNQILLRLLLESKGYTVDCASNGKEALNLLDSGSELPDVILVDLRMPVMDGIEFLRQQRNSLLLKDIPTVIMSADMDIESIRVKNESTGSSPPLGLLAKPLNIAAVIKSIERRLHVH